MTAYVVSDLHLGSRFTRATLFLDFLARLPPDAELILNGDVVDRMCRTLPPEHQQVLAALRLRAERAPVIWIRGNHDSRFTLPDPGRIRFCTSHAIDHRLYLEHGDNFSTTGPFYRLGVRCFRAFHNLLIACGAEAVHVAFFAKNFPHLYSALCRHVRQGALDYGRRHGFTAVACGHTHRAETALLQGVQYFNTGSWTEEPVHYLEITDTACTLKRHEPTPTP